MDFLFSLESQQDVLAVAFTPERGCWVALPQSLATRLFSSKLPLPIALDLTPVNSPSQHIYVGWTGATTSSPGTIGIPSTFARSLSLPETTPLQLQILTNIPQASSITLEPASSDDWEVVELNANFIEEQLLSQVGVTASGQSLPIWVRGQQTLLKVTATEPKSGPVKLVRGTEVAIAPRIRQSAANGGETHEVGDVLHDKQQEIEGENGGGEKLSQRKKLKTTVRVQVAPMSLVLAEEASAPTCSTKSEDSEAPATPTARDMMMNRGFMSPETMSRLGLVDGDLVQVCSIPTGPPPNQLGHYYRRAYTILSSWDDATPGHIAFPLDALSRLGLEKFELVTINELTEHQRAALEEASTQPLQGGDALMMHMKSRTQLMKRLMDMNSSDLDTYVQDSGAPPPPLTVNRDVLLQALERVLPVVAVPIKTVLQKWKAPKPGGVLIVGPNGSGKSSIVDALASIVERHPACLTRPFIVHCRDLSVDGGVGAVKAQLAPTLRALASRPPSLLVLDDIDALCPAAGDDPEGLRQEEDAGVVEWLCQVLDGLAEVQYAGVAGGGGGGHGGWLPVAVVATAGSTAAVSLPLRRPGRLDLTLTLPSPNATTRAAMLTAAAEARGAQIDSGAARVIAEAAEGFDGADLNILLDRAVQIAISRQAASSTSTRATSHNGDKTKKNGQSLAATKSQKPTRVDIKATDLEEAMKGLTPSAFWGVGTSGPVQKGTSGWEDVGGLSHVKDAMREALELPLKYSRLVARAPLRLRTGVLLYGPPGCGKTHIVAAAVAAARMRCITVSGPELLNKYIGASEAAVRDVFQRAAAAAPSVIFFDEFDALAPQRGHDNTGVTDRVVNQLLTELDGVEGLKGVCVIGATSRPDLIDAALLRPGRLDRILYCGFPSKAERVEILVALAKGLKATDDVNWEAVADETEGYSGADLGAVLSEAQLAAAHEALEAFELDGQRVEVVVGPKHLAAALDKARPSVPLAERQRLDVLYERFRSGDKAGLNEERARNIASIGSKVSWA